MQMQAISERMVMLAADATARVFGLCSTYRVPSCLNRNVSGQGHLKGKIPAP
jgi:hypothetical protein